MSRPDRQTAIVLLERTLTDFDYQPKTATGSLRLQAKGGEAPAAWLDCEDCGGRGKRRQRGIEVECEDCKGRGVRRGDPMTGRYVGSEESGLVDNRGWVRCDSCGDGLSFSYDDTGRLIQRAPGVHRNGQSCKHCADSGRPGWVRAPEQKARPWRSSTAPLNGKADTWGSGDPVLACMERRMLAGSYEELGLALGALRLERRLLYRMNVAVYVEAQREEDELDRYQGLLLDESLAYLERLMPAQIRVPSWAARYEERRREKAHEQRNGDEVAA